MALDHALALERAEDEGVLRLYGWSRPTVSFGRHEPALGRWDADAARALGVGFVRRPTGGRTVLHEAEVTYAVVAPLRAFGGPRDAYRSINQALLAGLAALGVEAGLEGPAAPAAAPDAGPCFQLPAAGEIVAEGRKLVGSAQARVGPSLLQHGSILLRDEQHRLRELQTAATPSGAADPAPPGLPVRGDRAPDAREVEASVARACALAWAGTWREAAPTPGELQRARTLRARRYASDSWTWRR